MEEGERAREEDGSRWETVSCYILVMGCSYPGTVFLWYGCVRKCEEGNRGLALYTPWVDSPNQSCTHHAHGDAACVSGISRLKTRRKCCERAIWEVAVGKEVGYLTAYFSHDTHVYMCSGED